MSNRFPDWMEGLSTRTANVLMRFDITSKEHAISVFGKPPFVPVGSVSARNYGLKSHKELAKFLGLPEPQLGIPKICPHCGGSIP